MVLLIISFGITLTGIKITGIYNEQRFLSEAQKVLSHLSMAQDLMLIMDTDIKVHFSPAKETKKIQVWLEIDKPLKQSWAHLIERKLTLSAIQSFEFNGICGRNLILQFSLGQMSTGNLTLFAGEVGDQSEKKSFEIELLGYPSPLGDKQKNASKQIKSEKSELLYPCEVYESLYKKPHKFKKHHFQLLELMVATFILLICIAPTMRIFTSIYQSQRSIVRENYRDHLAHMAHAKITEQLYKRQIPLGRKAYTHTIQLDDRELTELLQKFSYCCEATLQIIDSYTPRGEEHPTMSLGQIVIKMKDLSSKASKAVESQRFGNEDPSETFYDYFVYIDSGKTKNKKSHKKSQEEDVENQNPLNTGSTPPKKKNKESAK